MFMVGTYNTNLYDYFFTFMMYFSHSIISVILGNTLLVVLFVLQVDAETEIPNTPVLHNVHPVYCWVTN